MGNFGIPRGINNNKNIVISRKDRKETNGSHKRLGKFYPVPSKG